jgi:hypothetical protein
MVNMCKYMDLTYVSGNTIIYTLDPCRHNIDLKTYPGGQTGSPKYSIDKWNCYSRVLLNQDRTTNAVEGYNNCWNERVGRKSSSWGCFLGNIEDAARDSLKYIADVSFILNFFIILIYELIYITIYIFFSSKPVEACRFRASNTTPTTAASTATSRPSRRTARGSS